MAASAFQPKRPYCSLVYLCPCTFALSPDGSKVLEKPIEQVHALRSVSILCHLLVYTLEVHQQTSHVGFLPVGEVATQISLYLLPSKVLNLVSRDMSWRKAPTQKHKKSTHILMNMFCISISKLSKET